MKTVFSYHALKKPQTQITNHFVFSLQHKTLIGEKCFTWDKERKFKKLYFFVV